MKAVIVGGGIVGFQIAKKLVEIDANVVLIESDQVRAEYLSNHLDCLVINDEGNNIKVLRQAGISDADYFISMTNDDSVNLICCELADQGPYKIARVKNLDYASTERLKQNLRSIDLVVNPQAEAAEKIIHAVEHGAYSDVFSFISGRLRMRNLLITADSPFLGRSISDIKEQMPYDFLVAGIVRHDRFIVPTGDTQVKHEDNLYILASAGDIETIFDEIGVVKTGIRDILIIGGGKIGRQVAAHFMNAESPASSVLNRIVRPNGQTVKQREVRSIKIIERDYEKCKSLVKDFPSSMIINADISDESLFKEENLGRYDLIITATDRHELNVLSALYAKKMGVKRAISVANNLNYINMAIRLGIDVVVSPKNSIIDPIFKHIQTGVFKSVHSIADTEVDVIETFVKEKSRIAGKRVRDIHLPARSLILAVTRDGKNTIPDGGFIIESGDDLIVMSKEESVARLNKLFAEK
ncbi:MAG: Trk system potassium transport protein TrkA [candidate division KSB1 bacterium]|nr:Trk system potassium transport protein TrkA [candidate division KSB1 bacterium]